MLWELCFNMALFTFRRRFFVFIFLVTVLTEFVKCFHRFRHVLFYSVTCLTGYYRFAFLECMMTGFACYVLNFKMLGMYERNSSLLSLFIDDIFFLGNISGESSPPPCPMTVWGSVEMLRQSSKAGLLVEKTLLLL